VFRHGATLGEQRAHSHGPRIIARSNAGANQSDALARLKRAKLRDHNEAIKVL
jgi:hypothetical protein